jgi:hypothetical protein
MKRVVVAEGTVDDTGRVHMKLQAGPGTTLGELKRQVAARLDGARVFFVRSPPGDDVVFEGERLEFSHLDPGVHPAFEQHYEREVKQWAAAPSELLMNMKLN